MHFRIFLAAVQLAAAGAVAQPLELLTEENPPLNFLRSGEPHGTAVLVVREMLQRSGLEGAITVTGWARAFERARKDKQACVFSTVRNPAREKSFQWVGPVAAGVYSVFALADFPERIARADDLKSYRVAVARDARAAFLREGGVTRLLEADDDAALPRQLTNDLANEAGAQLWMTQAYGARAKAKASGVEVKPVFHGIMSRPYWLACHPGVAKPVVQKLNDALDGMRKDGTYSRLSDPESLR